MSYRANDGDSSDDERTSPFRYWNTRQPTTLTLASTLNPHTRVGRNPTGRNPTPLQTSVFSRPPSRTGPGTETSGSASFHSIEQGPESEPETGPTDEPTFHYEPEPESIMAPTATTSGERMDIDHEGKSYLKKPESFDGNRQKVNDFIHPCDLFFEGSSDKDFPSDKQKIIFILSYMNEGEALQWRKNYIKTIVKQTNGTYKWPTQEVFLKDFKAAFLYEDKKEESIRKLDHINQGNKTAEEYVNEFQLTVSKAGLLTDNDMMIRTFRKGLNKVLATRILYSNKKPNVLMDKVIGTGINATTKKGWYSIVIKFDRIHRDNVLALGERDDRPMGRQQNALQFRQVNGRGYMSGPAYQQGNSYQPKPQYNPNTMDVDTLTTEVNAMTFEE